MRVLLTKFTVRPLVLATTLLGVLTMAGCTSNNSSSEGSATATPTFNPGAGTYNASQTVTLADSTQGAVLYCTTDGTTPTNSSPQCSQPTTVFKTEFLQAIAVAPGKAPSAVASAGYTINLNAAATPTFSPSGGTYNSGQQITISDATTGANIYYTSDGTVPNANSTLYTGPITLSKSVTLTAIAIASGFSNSGISSASYVVSTAPAPPVISPSGGTFTSAQMVTISDATSGATIHYTEDGTTPTASSTSYSSAITVGKTETINAIAISTGGNSTIATAAFTINIPITPAPTFSPAAGTYTSAQTVLLSDSVAGAAIYYTLDGTTPTTNSQMYSSSGITVDKSETVEAIAVAPGDTASTVASAAYTINVTVPSPTFSPAGGNYTATQSVSLSDTNSSATIYYTTNGMPATTSSTVYSSANPIQVGSGTTTINALAAFGGATSTQASATYIVTPVLSYTGKVMSGTLPVAGATVQMYAAGTAGYASSGTLLTTTAAMTGSDGSFTLNFSCPALPGDLVYIVASGGHTGSNTSSNSGLALMVALGSCNGTLPKPVVVNEATTVASAYALSPFMTGAANVGSSTSNYQGLTNAYKTVNSLVDVTSGTVRDHTPDYTSNLAGDPNILNNSTVPQSRINTLANALNACVAAGAGCSSLFSAAQPVGGAVPADTLQAILNIAQNPGLNVPGVFNVVTTPGPFTPTLAAAPNDWTLALTFTGGGLGFAPGVPVGFANDPSTPGKFFNTAMAIDASGTVWVTGNNNDGFASGSYDLDADSGMIAAFDNLGAPLTSPSTVNAGVSAYGGYIAIRLEDNIGTGGTVNPVAIAIDPSGNAWVSGGSPIGTKFPQTQYALSEVARNGVSFSLLHPYFATGGQNVGNLAIDSSGDIWSYDATQLEEFGSDGTLLHSNVGTGVNGSALPPTSGYQTIQSLVFDSNGTLWGSATSPFFLSGLYQINPTDGSGIANYIDPFQGQYTSLAAGSNGNVYGCGEPGGQTLDVLNASSTSPLNQLAISTGRGCGNQMVMDGAGHLFTVTGGDAPGIIDEFTVSSSGLTSLSPVVTGYTGTGAGEAPAINPDPNAPLIVDTTQVQYVPPAGVMGAAIDGSGNLWVLNANTGTTATPGNVLVKFIGIAAPVVTPISQALANGQIGVRP